MAGVIKVAVTGLSYYYIEDIQGKVYSELSNILAWLHNVLMNVGVAAATWSLMYVGYEGGSYLSIHGTTNGRQSGTRTSTYCRLGSIPSATWWE